MTSELRPVPGDDGPVAVRGGVGGIRFQWEELEEAATALSLLAADAGDVAVALGYIERDVSEYPWRIMHLQPHGGVAGPYYQGARAHLEGAWTAALESGRALTGTEQRLRASLQAYRLADGVAQAATDAARFGSEATAQAIGRTAISQGAVTLGPITLQEKVRGSAVAFDGSVEAVLGRLAVVDDAVPGTFEVLRGGTEDVPVYVVVLPGTRMRAVNRGPGSNPFDPGGVVEAITEDSRYVEAAVLDALERSGAARGDAMIIAGYSQGGLHAVNLAASQGLAERYDVQLVLTAGAPTGWSTSGAAEYLHLEHRADAIPALDTVPNVDDRHRTTVTLGNPVPALGYRADGSREPWGLGPAHKLENYVEGARLIDASEAPSLVPAAALLAAAGVSGTARRHSFTAVRHPEPIGVRGTAGAHRTQRRGTRLGQ